MTSSLAVPTWLAVAVLAGAVALALVALLMLRAVARERRRTTELLRSAATDAEELRGQLAQIEQRIAEQAAAQERERAVPVRSDDREYVITDLGRERDRGARETVPALPGPVFVDILLRESLIRTTSLAAGLRRALAPEVRNRIRFEMKREVKRARKQRRTDLRTARREYEARQRAARPVAPGAETAR